MTAPPHGAAPPPPDHDVLVVGAGPAGLGAAMALGRLRRSALVCDDGRPRNAPARHMHNVPGMEGVPPLEWRAKARADVARYPSIRFHDGTVQAIEARAGGFAATIGAATMRVRKVILAYGIEDRLPPIPGLKELWGGAAFHCPFCHGYEHRDAKLGLVANGAQAMHMLPMLRGLTDDLVLFTNGGEVAPEQRAALHRRGIPIVEDAIARLEHEDGRLVGVHAGGRLVERTGLLVGSLQPYQPKSRLGELLGCARNDLGHYRVGEGNRTTVKGVYAAGDNMSPMQSVLAACAAGQVAGASAAMDLLQEDFHA
jgi:thioredoxin reductase